MEQAERGSQSKAPENSVPEIRRQSSSLCSELEVEAPGKTRSVQLQLLRFLCDLNNQMSWGREKHLVSQVRLDGVCQVSTGAE